MSLSDPKTQALFWRFMLILAVTDLPIVAAQLAQPTFDWRLLLAGLLTGACGALEKLLSPQVANVILPNTTILPPEKPPPD
jgi:hypothetical protein